MSERRTYGTSRPSLGAQVLAPHPSSPRENRSLKKGLGIHLDVPDALLPDVGDQPILRYRNVLGCYCKIQGPSDASDPAAALQVAEFIEPFVP